MVGKLIGALIGAEVEKRRQESGLKGAVIGAAAVGVAKRIVPLTLLVGGVLVARHMLSRGEDKAGVAAA